MRPYMTEEEAKAKWCPMVRHGGDNSTFNRGGLNVLNDHKHNQGMLCNCIASGCMWWGWEHCETERRGRCEVNGGGE